MTASDKISPDFDQIEQAPRGAPDHANFLGKDKAAQFLKEHGEQIILTPDEDRRVLKMIDWRIMPLLLTIYSLQFLDKATLSYASVFGLIQDTGLKGEEYSWLGAIVYLAQLVCQPLVAFFLVTLPMGKFVTFIVFSWGAVLCGMVAARNFSGLMASRFLLGAFEAAVAPAFIAIVQMWYKRSEQTIRISAWYCTVGVVNTLGSLLTYGLAHIKSPLHEYQIIFLFCGSITVAVSFVVLFFMPDSPFEAKFLTDHDKTVAIERLRSNQMGVASRVWKWPHVWEACRDPKTWFWFSMIFAVSVPSGGISTFGPLIVKTFTADKFSVILYNMPFGAINVVSCLSSAYLATKYKRKGPILALLCLPSIAGAAILLCIEHTAKHRGVLLAGYCLVAFYPGITPLIYSWSGQNTAGDTKRKCTTGLLFIGSCAGNVVGPHLYKPEEAPGYHRGLISNMILFIVLIGLVALTTLYLVFLNKRHASKRVAAGKSADIVDHSMETKKAEEARFEAGETQGEDMFGDKAFDDETDLRNEDFIYVY